MVCCLERQLFRLGDGNYDDNFFFQYTTKIDGDITILMYGVGFKFFLCFHCIVWTTHLDEMLRFEIAITFDLLNQFSVRKRMMFSMPWRTKPYVLTVGRFTGFKTTLITVRMAVALGPMGPWGDLPPTHKLYIKMTLSGLCVVYYG